MNATAKHIFTTASVCLTVMACVHVIARAGSLTPPGAPGPTMKTIEEAEPRVFISQADIPYVISAPGSYYLAGDIVAPAFMGAAITIDVDHVTLDMRGFAIRNGAAVAFQHGIDAGRATNNVVIRNGTVRGSTSDGIALATVEGVELHNVRLLSNGGDGADLGAGAIVVECFSAENFAGGLFVGSGSTVDSTVLRDNGGAGLDTGAGSSVDRCTSEGNDGRGFDLGADSIISRSSARANGGIGILVGDNGVATDCTARGNGSDPGVDSGIFLGAGSAARGCASRGNVGAGFDASSTGGALSDCIAVDNAGHGIIGGGGATLRSCHSSSNDLDGFSFSSGVSAEGCSARLNGRDGFRTGAAASLSNCVAEGNGADGTGDGFRFTSSGVIASACIASGNSDDGFDIGVGSVAQGCTAGGNGDDGFTWVDACRIIGNVARANGDDGYYGPGEGPIAEQSMIMDNLAHGNGGDGFEIGFGFNLIGRNLASGGDDYNLLGTQYSGEVQLGAPIGNPLSDDPFVNVH